MEDFFKEIEQVGLQITRKKNLKRKDMPCVAYIKEAMRKIIETSIIQVTNLIPRHIHAVTANGFIIKLILLVMAFQTKI